MAHKYMIYEVRYNEKANAYETWAAITEDHYPKKEDFWLEMSCQCVEAKSFEGKNFIHSEILKAITRAYYQGFEVDYRIKLDEK